MQSLNRQKILIGVLIVVLAIAGIYYYNLYFSNSDSYSSEGSIDSTDVIVGEDVLILVNKLQAVSFDQNVFSDNVFTSLRDLTVSINPENQSRPNPFAPIGTDIGTVQFYGRVSSSGM